MISGKGGFTRESLSFSLSFSLFVVKRERETAKRREGERREKRGEERRERVVPVQKPTNEGRGNILKDAFRLNAANEIVLVKRRGGTGEMEKGGQ